jgi:peptidoglycan hydrolase-like protein with peptidoglycan-binding domain
VLVGAAVLIAVIAISGVVAMSSTPSSSSAQDTPPNTVQVVRGSLSSMISENGTLTYRARSDGSPYSVINQASGTYTELPSGGDKVDCGGVLYRVDDEPVLLLCGAVPAYRYLRSGDKGNDVRQLNANLHALGYDAGGIAPDDDTFTSKTAMALAKLQHDKGIDATGTLALDAAVFVPESVRIAKVIGELGGSAQPGALVAQATSDAPEVQVDLEPSQQGVVKEGDRVQVTLPGNVSVTGKVDRLGKVAEIRVSQNGDIGAATIPAYIGLDDPGRARGLDHAPVRLAITTTGVEDALSVPVIALVGRSGGGFAVEVVRGGGRRELVAVELGLFDSGGGRVQVEGDVHEGERVVVPSS